MAVATYITTLLYLIIIIAWLAASDEKYAGDHYWEETGDVDHAMTMYIIWSLFLLIVFTVIPSGLFMYWQCKDTVKSRNFLTFIPIIWAVALITNFVRVV